MAQMAGKMEGGGGGGAGLPQNPSHRRRMSPKHGQNKLVLSPAVALTPIGNCSKHRAHTVSHERGRVQLHAQQPF